MKGFCCPVSIAGIRPGAHCAAPPCTREQLQRIREAAKKKFLSDRAIKKGKGMATKKK